MLPAVVLEQLYGLKIFNLKIKYFFTVCTLSVIIVNFSDNAVITEGVKPCFSLNPDLRQTENTVQAAAKTLYASLISAGEDYGNTIKSD